MMQIQQSVLAGKLLYSFHNHYDSSVDLLIHLTLPASQTLLVKKQQRNSPAQVIQKAAAMKTKG